MLPLDNWSEATNDKPVFVSEVEENVSMAPLEFILRGQRGEGTADAESETPQASSGVENGVSISPADYKGLGSVVSFPAESGAESWPKFGAF